MAYNKFLKFENKYQSQVYNAKIAVFVVPILIIRFSDERFEKNKKNTYIC